MCRTVPSHTKTETPITICITVLAAGNNTPNTQQTRTITSKVKRSMNISRGFFVWKYLAPLDAFLSRKCPFSEYLCSDLFSLKRRTIFRGVYQPQL
jgi:hypothetical protein